jgi:predicted nucleic acid-binding protein
VTLVGDARDLERAWDLARRYDNRRIHELLYVALAERRKTQLVTADASLRRALVGLDWVVGPKHYLT